VHYIYTKGPGKIKSILMQIKPIALLIMLPVFFACSGNKNKCSYPSIVPETGSDLNLSVVSQTKQGNYYELITRGCYNGEAVGLKILLKDSIPAGSKNAKDAYVENGIRLSSLGTESDNLMKAMGEIYKVDASKKFSAQELSYALYSQNSQPVDYSKGAYRLVMFSGEGAIYFDKYITVDFTNKRVTFMNNDENMNNNFILAIGAR
jgi:hypothetical protein